MDAVTFSEVGFGQFGNGAVEDYVLIADFDDFLGRFAPVFDECIQELRRDDALTGGFEPPYPGASSYPTLEELWELSPSDRMEMIGTYFAFDILRMYLREDDGGTEASWTVKSLEAVDRRGSGIVVRGRVAPRHGLK